LSHHVRSIYVHNHLCIRIIAGLREPGGLRQKSYEANKLEIPIKKGRALNDLNRVSLP